MARPPAVLLLLAPAVLAQWGRDIAPGAGPHVFRLAGDDLLPIVQAAPDERPALVERFVETHGVARMEGWKRYRNPELKPLFLRLLAHDDWHVRHRALLALEAYGGRDVVDAAWALLDHPQRRLREKAAITCLKLWDGRARDGLDARIEDERDFHVRRCLEALAARVAGKLAVHRVHEEHVRTYESGLAATPFLNGMDQVARAAPGYRARPEARTGGGSARRLPATDRWTTPLLGWGEEEVAGTSLQPFANLRAGGTVYHTGQDAGAALDGCGYYAAAAGVVMLVHTGSDMGTMLVVQHHLGGGDLVNAVYMHGGGAVFVEAGDTVACGQLLGTMGTSFSIENGGHYAHLHYGLYEGPFDLAHNYGYKPVEAGLADWIDPAWFLPHWIERTRPLVPDLRAVDRSLDGVVRSVGRGDLARAHAAAVRARDRAEPGSVPHVDATYLVSALEEAPRRAEARVTKLLEAGFAADALDEVDDLAKTCRGIPGADALEALHDRWKEDPAVEKAADGERKLEAARRRADRAKDRREARAIWQDLLEDYGDTVLRKRIERQLSRLR